MKRHLALLMQVAGLFATAWVVWTAAVVPNLTRLPLAAVINEALKHALVACTASAFITLGLYLFIARSARSDALVAALRTSSTAVWFAPATLLLSALSPMFFAAALVLVISSTRLLYCEWRRIHPDQPPVPTLDRELFELPPSPLRLGELAPSLLASFCVEMGVVAVLIGDPLPAAFLFCMATSMLTLAALGSGAYEPRTERSLPRSVLGLALTVILAASFTVSGVAGRIQHGLRSPGTSGHRPGPMQSVRALLEHLFEGNEPAQPQGTVTKVYAPPAGNVEIDDKSFPGVVLWSEPRPTAKFVEPRPGWARNPLPAVPIEPSILPFTGEYWMFRPPATQPPRKSYSRWGSPLTLSFLTTDHAEMSMEAHQKLEHAIDLNCCGEIQIVILNADRYPATVALELILSDDGVSQSLGTDDVPSRPQVTLRFPVPLGSSLHQFSEFKIVFHRDRVRIDRSARIAIEHFVLLPRT